MFLCLSAPHEVFTTEGEKQEFGFSKFDLVILVQHRWRVHRIAIEVDDPVGITGEQHSLFLFGVKHNDRVVAAGNFIVAQNLNIHVIRAPDEIFALHDLIILALAGAVDAHDPAAHRLDVIAEQLLLNLHIGSLRFPLLLGRGLDIAVRTYGTVSFLAENMPILAVDQI